MKKTIRKRIKTNSGNIKTMYACKLCGALGTYKEDAEQCYVECSEWARRALAVEFGIKL